jgi:glutamine amidotransferase
LSHPAPEIALLDFGMGNMRSVVRAFEHAGARPCVVEDPDKVRRADRMVLPGVGSFGDCMRTLRERGLDEALQERFRAGSPYLGICLGLHALFEWGEEGGVPGLGLLAGRVERFPEASGLPVPHMGWNRVELERPHPVVGPGYYYFVHSYRAVGAEPELELGTTDYGGRFASVVGTETAVAVQFHPEKSQRTGLALLERFSQWSP